MVPTRHPSSIAPAPEGLLSVNELACQFGISRWTVYRMVRSGDIKAVRVGERIRFRPADVDAYLERGA